jgi:hypothetical protein
MYFHHYYQDVERPGLLLATIFRSQERQKILFTLIRHKFDIDKLLNV